MTQTKTWTLDERTEMSRAFYAGNYANAYETTDLLACEEIEDMSEHERAAFVLGFFGSYERSEMGSDVETYDAAYWSPAGRYVVLEARYTDSRDEEYAAESEDS